MAYFRTTTNKHGAKTTKLILTARDRAIQKQRSLDRAGVPAWRMFLQNRRADWRISFYGDLSEIQIAYNERSTELKAFRARYLANLAYKHRGVVPPTFFKVGNGPHCIANYCFDIGLDLDQWAIDNAIQDIRYYERVARAYGVSLESDHA